MKAKVKFESKSLFDVGDKFVYSNMYIVKVVDVFLTQKGWYYTFDKLYNQFSENLVADSELFNHIILESKGE